MSSYKNAFKSQKTHKERSQPSSRAHLGLLEKKKDYKLRAVDYQKKKNAIKALKRKALDKNPDEFYFKMVHTKMEDGVHQTEDETPEYTDEQLKMMQTQDLKYINYKRSADLKKIEKLKADLHLLDFPDKPQNKHIIFVDSEKEAKKLDLAKHFDTHPALLQRPYNRLKREQLKNSTISGAVDDDTLQTLSHERQKKYRELEKRIEREHQLSIIAQKMETKKQLMDKKHGKRRWPMRPSSQQPCTDGSRSAKSEQAHNWKMLKNRELRSKSRLLTGMS